MTDVAEGFTTFDQCYTEKRTLWETMPDYIPIDEEALELEK